MKTNTLHPEYGMIVTTDHLSLPYLFFNSGKNSHAVAIYLHGNGSASVFHDFNRMKYLSQSLKEKNTAFFAFNNRGSNVVKEYIAGDSGKSLVYGSALEKIKECLIDIDAAVAFLHHKGFTTFYLIGSSTGANKVCVYNHYKKNTVFTKYILLSPADDRGIYFKMLGRKKFDELYSLAQKKLVCDLGSEIILPTILHGEILSYKSFIDVCRADGDYNVFPFLAAVDSGSVAFTYFSEISIPVLVIIGEKDQYLYKHSEKIEGILRNEITDKRKFTFQTIMNADHSFTNKWNEVGEIIANWM